MNEWHNEANDLMMKALGSEWPCDNQPLLKEE
jgi:hypothetical protein